MPRQPKPRWNSKRRVWFANVGDPGPDGRAREVYAPPAIGERDEAAAWEWFRGRVAAREAVPVVRGGLSVEGLCELYLLWAEGRRAEGKMGNPHFTNKALHLTHLSDWGGGRPARDLGPDALEDFVAAMRRRGYAPSYLANLTASAVSMLRWGVKAHHLASNPAEGFAHPVVPCSPERFAERSEAASWLRWCWRRTPKDAASWPYARNFALMQRLLIHSGARPGEACALEWRDLKWGGWATKAGHAAAKATIPTARWKDRGRTGESRTIYVSPSVSRALRREAGRTGRHMASVFVHGRGRGGKGAGEPWESGSRLSKTVLRIRREAIAAAALARGKAEAGGELTPAEASAARIRFEDGGANRLVNYRWRHTAASELLMLGIDPTTVAKLLGTSVEMLTKHYGHLLDRHLAEAAGRLDGRPRRVGS